MQQSSAAWEHFWASGNHAGCVNASEEGYRQEIVHFWQAQWQRLASHACWLDIGTGNGAIPRIVSKLAAENTQPTTILGVDAANIDYTALGQLPELQGVKLYANTPVTALPCDDNSIDLISGQYAYEYMHSADAARELARVLKPAAKAVFVMHHRQGLTVTGAQQTLQFIRSIDTDTRIFATLSTFIKTLCKERQTAIGGRFEPSAALIKHKQKCDKALKKLSKGTEHHNSRELAQNVVGICQQLMVQNAQFTEAQMLEKLEELRISVHHHKQRLLMLKQAAVDEKSLRNLEEALTSAGFVGITHASLTDPEGTLIAHVLEAVKG